MQVRDVMSSPVISVRPHVPVGGAAALLVSHGFTAVPVVDAEGHLRGLVTEADLMRGRIAADGEPVDSRAGAGPAVSTVMTPRPHVVEADADIADVADLMLRTHTRSMPVLNNGKLVGMVTPRDLLRVVATRALEAAHTGR